ncbi:MAG: SDR family NAD(P)-dependent oxidoreductase [Acidimicrobiia bacterium]
MTDLGGVVVAITGAGSGIGRALAQGFRDDGATVVGCDLPGNVAVAEEVCALAGVADVTSREELAAWVETVVDRFGRIDVVIANAGISRRGSVEDVDPADLEAVYRTNVFGVINTFRAVLPAMRAQGRGRLIAVASRTAEFCPGDGVAYSSSKAAVLAIVRSLAHALDGTDILANAMFPGICRTAMNPAYGQDPALAYPTARLLATLPAHGASGRTFADEAEYPIYDQFADDTKPALA